MDRIGLSDIVCEMQRLLAEQVKHKPGTPEREDADHAMTMLLRYNAQGRIQEYFALRDRNTQ